MVVSIGGRGLTHRINPMKEIQKTLLLAAVCAAFIPSVGKAEGFNRYSHAEVEERIDFGFGYDIKFSYQVDCLIGVYKPTEPKLGNWKVIPQNSFGDNIRKSCKNA